MSSTDKSRARAVADLTEGYVLASVEIGAAPERVFRALASDEIVDWWGDDLRFIIDTFGAARCMFESNYPVDRRAVAYTVLWNTFQKVAGGYADDEQDALFATTATRVYRIDS